MKINLLASRVILFLLLSSAAWTQTATFTPNLTLTPPCNPATFFGNDAGSSPGSSVDYMRGSLYTLNSPATVYTLTVACDNPPSNQQLIVGIYSGAVSNFGSLIVQSAAQTVAAGWNGFPITPTYLTAGTYWLAYLSNDTGYYVTETSTGPVSGTQAFSSIYTAFGSMPNTMPTPSYGTYKESIYALYCAVSTNTPTNTDTSTITMTATNTFTSTISSTPTNTGTIFTNTPSSTSTPTPTLTATNTITLTPTMTPNLLLTPSCGSSMGSFGDSDTAGSPVTASYSIEMRACRYTLPSDSTVQTMSLYATSYSAGSIAEVALYTNSASTTTLGSLVAQSVTQTLTAGWNVFQVPSSPVTAGDYWLAYIFDAPVSYSLVYQAYPAGVNTSASVTAGLSWTFASSGSGYSATYANNWNEPILANFCPGMNTSTPMNTATLTSTSTQTNTASNTATETPTETSTDTASLTSTSTTTNTPTVTQTSTVSTTNTVTETATDSTTATTTSSPSLTATASASLTPTLTTTESMTDTPTNSPTVTATSTSTDTAGNTATTTSTNSPTNTGTATVTNTGTNTPTNTATITDTPIFSYTPTATATATVTLTVTPTATSTVTNSATNTASLTVTPTFSGTFTVTFTSTITNTGSPSITATFTQTPSLTSTGTPLMTATSSPTVTSTATSSAVNTLSIFPNPAQGPSGVNIRILFNNPHDYVEIKVFTTSFRKIFDDRLNYTSAGMFNYSLDPSKLKGSGTLANGLYYVLVVTPSNRWMSKLLILR
jgi:hypothetical protein